MAKNTTRLPPKALVPQPVVTTDEDIINTIRVAVNQIANLLTEAKTRRLDLNFNLAPAEDDPDVVVVKDFRVMKVLA